MNARAFYLHTYNYMTYNNRTIHCKTRIEQSFSKRAII